MLFPLALVQQFNAVAFVEHAGTVPRTRGFPSHWMLFHMVQPMNQPLEIAIPCESARSDVVLSCRVCEPTIPHAVEALERPLRLLGCRNGRVTALGSK